jgi:hypothetical protein
MANLQDLINLAKVDGGKFFVLDETGEAKLVILPLEEYQKLLLGKLQKQVNEVENINRKIIEAQLESEKGLGLRAKVETPKPVSQSINQQVSQSTNHIRVDLREEVIDPSFDFEGPKIEIDDL